MENFVLCRQFVLIYNVIRVFNHMLKFLCQLILRPVLLIFFSFISYFLRKCCSEAFYKILLKSKKNISDGVPLKKLQVAT